MADLEQPEPMERIAVDEPTMSLLFTINTSPFLGKDGEFSPAVTSAVSRRRAAENLALRVEATDSEDRWNVRPGILHERVVDHAP